MPQEQSRESGHVRQRKKTEPGGPSTYVPPRGKEECLPPPGRLRSRVSPREQRTGRTCFPTIRTSGTRRGPAPPPRRVVPGCAQEEVLRQGSSESFPAAVGRLGDDGYRPRGLREKGEPPVRLPHAGGADEKRPGGAGGRPGRHVPSAVRQ